MCDGPPGGLVFAVRRSHAVESKSLPVVGVVAGVYASFACLRIPAVAPLLHAVANRTTFLPLAAGTIFQ